MPEFEPSSHNFFCNRAIEMLLCPYAVKYYVQCLCNETTHQNSLSIAEPWPGTVDYFRSCPCYTLQSRLISLS